MTKIRQQDAARMRKNAALGITGAFDRARPERMQHQGLLRGIISIFRELFGDHCVCKQAGVYIYIYMCVCVYVSRSGFICIELLLLLLFK